MIGLNEAKRMFNKAYPDRTISNVYKHPTGYLFVASKKGVNPFSDFSDPYFLFNEKNGKIVGYLPSDHFDEYEKVFTNQLE